VTEVVVVGAGIVGTAVARELAVRGVDVALLDRGVVASGTTGLGEGNVLCSDKPAGPELELTRAGMDLYGELEQRLGDEARIRRKGALIVHTDAETWAAEPARLEAMAVAGARLVGADEVRALEPELTGDVHGASLFPDDVQCDPRAIARALAREAARAGATIREGCAVKAIAMGGRVEHAGSRGDEPAQAGGNEPGPASGDEPRRGVSVLLAGGERVRARAVVVAAGSWSAPLAAGAGLQLPLEPRKGQLVRLAAPEPGLVRHKVVDAAYMHSVKSGAPGLELSTVVETTFDGDILVGSSRERRGFDTAVDPTVGQAMVERAARLFPRMRRLTPTAAWAGLRPWLPDNLPAIGPSHAVPGLWLATGHEGAGVALGPVTGRLIAQLYTGEQPVVDPAPFDADRFSRSEARLAARRAALRRATRRSRAAPGP
jgi:glycine/D-amino acid oxidase-like deaminating enzyme